jgi:CelD/BcsL family acetyltransferase involved in cellulose biosynthesis
VRAGISVRVNTEETYTIALPRSFDEYLSSLSANAKKNVRRLANRIDKAGTSRLLVFHGKEAIAEWSASLRIENAGWKGSAGSSLARVTEPLERHYAGWLELLAARNELSLYFLALDDRRIAGLFGYIEGDVSHWFKAGYDETFAEFAPSTTLIVRIVKDLIANESCVRRVHLFPVDFGYKHRYANEQSVATRTLVYNSTLRGRVAYAQVVARERLKNIAWIRKAARALKR